MYFIAKNLLFCLDPEVAHDLSMEMMGAAERLHLLKPFCAKIEGPGVDVMGLHFPNPVGLAAGLDKNADYLNGLGQLGFGFIEVGTVTPRPQPGNPQPRLFRLKEEEAIINRMGFNNKGVAHLVGRVKKRRYSGILGINVGKNKLTAEVDALRDYQLCMEAVYQYADYITVNISSPNTPGLRNLQFGDAFEALLKGIKLKQKELSDKHQKYVPIAVKIAPDMSEDELYEIAKALLAHNIDGVIATNTTLARDGVSGSRYKDQAGGLSGRPLTAMSTQTIKLLSLQLKDEIPIIGVGGIMSGACAKEKIDAGASLVQIYTGFIYQGPGLIKEAAESISPAL
ncbi:MAG: dihydroorotate dehydrogenase [Lentisphaeria bacterium]|jgi:dihydroorotate dehydrogenase